MKNLRAIKNIAEQISEGALEEPRRSSRIQGIQSEKKPCILCTSRLVQWGNSMMQDLLPDYDLPEYKRLYAGNAAKIFDQSMKNEFSRRRQGLELEPVIPHVPVRNPLAHVFDDASEEDGPRKKTLFQMAVEQEFQKQEAKGTSDIEKIAVDNMVSESGRPVRKIARRKL